MKYRLNKDKFNKEDIYKRFKNVYDDIDNYHRAKITTTFNDSDTVMELSITNDTDLLNKNKDGIFLEVAISINDALHIYKGGNTASAPVFISKTLDRFNYVVEPLAELILEVIKEEEPECIYIEVIEYSINEKGADYTNYKIYKDNTTKEVVKDLDSIPSQVALLFTVGNIISANIYISIKDLSASKVLVTNRIALNKIEGVNLDNDILISLIIDNNAAVVLSNAKKVDRAVTEMLSSVYEAVRKMIGRPAVKIELEYTERIYKK